jgi:hypothetical protein
MTTLQRYNSEFRLDHRSPCVVTGMWFMDELVPKPKTIFKESYHRNLLGLTPSIFTTKS